MKRWILIATPIVLVSGGVAWYIKLKPADKPPPWILIVGDQYNLGGEREKDNWGYRKPLQDLLGRGEYDFIGSHRFPEGSSTYDPDTSAEFYQRILDCKVSLGHSLDQLMGKAPPGSWIIIFIGTKDVMQPRMGLKSLIWYFGKMVRKIHNFNPDIGVIVARLPPEKTQIYDRKIIQFNGLVLEALQDLWYQAEKKNLFIPDLYTILTSVPGWRRRILGRTFYPSPLGWQIIAETFSDIILGKQPPNYDYSIPQEKK